MLGVGEDYLAVPTEYYDVLREAKAAEGWSLDSATLLASNSPFWISGVCCLLVV